MSRAQLSALGVRDDAIRHRIAIRRLHRVHAGVYAIGDRPGLHGLFMAAVLSCGDHAVLSHRSAAALWDLRPAPSGAIEVTVPRGGGRCRKGITVHTTRSLSPEGITTHAGVRCTTPARTLIDLAAVASPHVVKRALEQSLILQVFDGRALQARLEEVGRRRGTGTLRRLLAELADEPAPVRTELERRFLELVRRAGLPLPVVNAVVAGHEVDFHWPAARLVVETDGRATHDTAYGFARDRRRDLDLELAGWHVVRVTWRQVVHEPGRVAALLRRWLAPAAPPSADRAK